MSTPSGGTQPTGRRTATSPRQCQKRGRSTSGELRERIRSQHHRERALGHAGVGLEGLFDDVADPSRRGSTMLPPSAVARSPRGAPRAGRKRARSGSGRSLSGASFRALVRWGAPGAHPPPRGQAEPRRCAGPRRGCTPPPAARQGRLGTASAPRRDVRRRASPRSPHPRTAARSSAEPGSRRCHQDLAGLLAHLTEIERDGDIEIGRDERDVAEACSRKGLMVHGHEFESQAMADSRSWKNPIGPDRFDSRTKSRNGLE